MKTQAHTPIFACTHALSKMPTYILIHIFILTQTHIFKYTCTYIYVHTLIHLHIHLYLNKKKTLNCVKSNPKSTNPKFMSPQRTISFNVWKMCLFYLISSKTHSNVYEMIFCSSTSNLSSQKGLFLSMWEKCCFNIFSEIRTMKFLRSMKRILNCVKHISLNINIELHVLYCDIITIKEDRCWLIFFKIKYWV